MMKLLRMVFRYPGRESHREMFTWKGIKWDLVLGASVLLAGFLFARLVLSR